MLWKKAAAPRSDTTEGPPIELDPKELYKALLNPNEWTPGSLLRVLYWLALGAPYGRRGYGTLRRSFDEFASAIERQGLAESSFDFD